MRIKDLFTVPSGERVTERHLRRVLLSSVCSILLCMSMLVGTTWAWFTVSVENEGNVIEIAQSEFSSEVLLYSTGTPVAASPDGSYILAPDTYVFIMKWANNAQGNDLGTAMPAYGIITIVKENAQVVMALEDETVTDSEIYYMELTASERGIRIHLGATAKVSFEVSRVKPENATPLDEIKSLSIIGEESSKEESSQEESSIEESSQEESSIEESSQEESSKEESSQEESSKEESSQEESSIEESSQEESSIEESNQEESSKEESSQEESSIEESNQEESSSQESNEANE